MPTTVRQASFGEIRSFPRVAEAALLEVRHRPRMSLPAHAHENGTLTLVLQGAFTERLGSRSHQCDALVLIYKPPGASHSNQYSCEGARSFTIDIPVASELGETLSVLREPSVERTAASVRMIELYRRARRGDEVFPLDIEVLFTDMARWCQARSRMDSRVPDWLARIRDRLIAEFRGPPSLTVLSREADVHRTHVSRAFRHHYGMTITEFVQRLRIDAIMRQGNERPPEGLSGLCSAGGFYDQAHLTRTFRRWTGLTPGVALPPAHPTTREADDAG